MTVVDFGAAPGGWSQVVAKAVGRGGRVIAVDVLDIEQVPGVTAICGDFTEDETRGSVESALEGHQVDLVLSDIAPNIGGFPSADQARSDGACRACR